MWPWHEVLKLHSGISEIEEAVETVWTKFTQEKIAAKYFNTRKLGDSTRCLESSIVGEWGESVRKGGAFMGDSLRLQRGWCFSLLKVYTTYMASDLVVNVPCPSCRVSSVHYSSHCTVLQCLLLFFHTWDFFYILIVGIETSALRGGD